MHRRMNQKARRISGGFVQKPLRAKTRKAPAMCCNMSRRWASKETLFFLFNFEAGVGWFGGLDGHCGGGRLGGRDGGGCHCCECGLDVVERLVDHKRVGQEESEKTERGRSLRSAIACLSVGHPADVDQGAYRSRSFSIRHFRRIKLPFRIELPYRQDFHLLLQSHGRIGKQDLEALLWKQQT
ncbi:hypothetical protein KCU93_g479, partial [Aureobasidium melanogenum]